MERPSSAGQLARHHTHHHHHHRVARDQFLVDAVMSPTSATSAASLSDILATKRSSWPRVALHPSGDAWPGAPAPAAARGRHGGGRAARRARSSSPFGGGGRGVDDGWRRLAAAATVEDGTPTSPVDGATVVRCLDSCDKILLRHSTTIT